MQQPFRHVMTVCSRSLPLSALMILLAYGGLLEFENALLLMFFTGLLSVAYAYFYLLSVFNRIDQFNSESDFFVLEAEVFEVRKLKVSDIRSYLHDFPCYVLQALGLTASRVTYKGSRGKYKKELFIIHPGSASIEPGTKIDFVQALYSGVGFLKKGSNGSTIYYRNKFS